MILDPAVQVAVVTGTFGFMVALAGLGVEMFRRQTRAISEVKAHASATAYQVQNSHETNLRDDVDRVLHGLDRVLEGQRQHGKEIGGIRDDMRVEREERLAVSDRLDDLIRNLGS